MSASIEVRDGSWHLRFRYRQRQYQKSLGKIAPDTAEAIRKSAVGTLELLRVGLRSMPPEADVVDYVVSGGTQSAPRPPAIAANTVAALIPRYLNHLKTRGAAETYQKSQKIHLGYLSRHLGNAGQVDVGKVTRKSLQALLDARLSKRHPGTVKKERVTLRSFFAWAEKEGFVERSPARELDTIRDGSESPPFKTKAEIEQLVKQAKLTGKQEQELWKRLYLSPAELAELLETVRQRAADMVSRLLHEIPAYTGMRRGEVLRLRWEDIDFEQGFIVARSRKQSKRRREVLRRIDLHPELTRVLKAWKRQHPGGEFVLCKQDSLGPLNPDEANRLFWKPLRNTTWCIDSDRNWFRISGFHMYRHSFVSNLAAAGVDQRIIDEFVGHETEAMRRRYRHLFPSNRRAAIETFCLTMVTRSTAGVAAGTRVTRAVASCSENVDSAVG